MAYPRGPAVAMSAPQNFHGTYVPHQEYLQRIQTETPGQYRGESAKERERYQERYPGNQRVSYQQQQQQYPLYPSNKAQEADFTAGPLLQPEYVVSPGTAPPPTKRSTIIEPDPLPPHSNPQALSPTQSSAFEGPAPIPPVRLSKDAITDARSDAILFAIQREAKHGLGFLTTKPVLRVRRTSNAATVGTIEFKALKNSGCDLTVNGKQTRLFSDGFLHFRWCFRSTSARDGTNDMWYFRKTKSDIVLEDAKKHGRAIARLKGNVLSFEKGGLNNETIDETVLTFVALAEAARRAGKVKDVGELTGAIGDLGAFGDGGSNPGDGGGGGGGGT